MKPSDRLAPHRAAIRRVVQAHHACNARIFGSVARGEDGEGSDLDVLIDPTPETTLLGTLLKTPENRTLPQMTTR